MGQPKNLVKSHSQQEEWRIVIVKAMYIELAQFITYRYKLRVHYKLKTVEFRFQVKAPRQKTPRQKPPGQKPSDNKPWYKSPKKNQGLDIFFLGLVDPSRNRLVSTAYFPTISSIILGGLLSGGFCPGSFLSGAFDSLPNIVYMIRSVN